MTNTWAIKCEKMGKTCFSKNKIMSPDASFIPQLKTIKFIVMKGKKPENIHI